MHTPGPWTMELDVTDDGHIDVFGPDWTPVAIIDVRDNEDDVQSNPREVALANGRLIAAAPDMLAALKRVAGVLGLNGPGIFRGVVADEIRAALAKAEGR